MHDEFSIALDNSDKLMGWSITNMKTCHSTAKIFVTIIRDNKEIKIFENHLYSKAKKKELERMEFETSMKIA